MKGMKRNGILQCYTMLHQKHDKVKIENVGFMVFLGCPRFSSDSQILFHGALAQKFGFGCQ